MSTESEYEREMEQRNDEAMYYAAKDADDLAKADAELATLRKQLAEAEKARDDALSLVFGVREHEVRLHQNEDGTWPCSCAACSLHVRYRAALKLAEDVADSCGDHVDCVDQYYSREALAAYRAFKGGGGIAKALPTHGAVAPLGAAVPAIGIGLRDLYRERDETRAALATAEADCAAMRELLKDSRPSVALLGVCFDAAHVPDHYRETYTKNAKAHKVLLGEIDAALSDPHGTVFLERLKLAEAGASKQIHCLYDLLVEAGSPTQQYDFETRRRLAVESAQKFLRGLPHGR